MKAALPPRKEKPELWKAPAHLACRAVWAHVGHDTVLAESPNAGPQDVCAHERRAATGHVHIARAGKIDDAHGAWEDDCRRSGAALDSEW